MSLSLCFVLSSPLFFFSFPFVFCSFGLKRAKRTTRSNRTKAPKRSKSTQEPNPPIRFYTTYILPSGGLYATYHLFTGTKKQKELTKKKAAGLYIHHLSEPDVEMRFSWVKDLAPLVVHVHLDKHLGCCCFCRGVFRCGAPSLWFLLKSPSSPQIPKFTSWLGHLFFWGQKKRSKNRGSNCS